MTLFLHLSTMNFVVDDDDIPEDDVIIFSILYSCVTVVFAMAVLSKFLTNEFRFGFRSALSLAVLFLGEPLCQFFVKGPLGVGCFAAGCLLIYSILPASHLPVGNKAVVITGCDSGFGNALVKKLDAIGMHVYAGCLDKDGPGAVSLRHTCSDRMHLLQLDVTKDEDISKAVEIVRLDVGSEGLWGLVNNAGVCYFSELEMTPEPIMRKMFDVNLFGTVNTTKAFLPLIRQAKGRIVVVSSVLGRISFEGYGAYGMAKHALMAFSDTLRQEMKKWSVNVSIIEPTGYRTGNVAESTLKGRKEEIWEKLDENAKATYGLDYLDEIYSSLMEQCKTFPDDLTPVVRAMRSGLLSKRPKERYPCGAGADIFTYVMNLLPIWWGDTISLAMSPIPKSSHPAALRNDQ
ncbi:retinol dehydrogenase 7-like [Mya arenaria]|uniref:retinol dehydrogenase 7-like n=1 Tax=Mya arenaria TaxID=6604 RepID=UPI0022E0DCD4|nr:retinol dehydrogenase 7-like [Mya arenaria]